MAFQILDKNNNAITLGQLDKEAANFWDVEVNSKSYAKPKNFPAIGCDWYNWVGLSIAQLPANKYIEWSDVVGKLCAIAAIGEVNMEGLLDSIKAYKPFIDLCFYWQSKGYKPVSC